MHTAAVVISQPERLDLRELRLPEPASDEIVVDVEWSGISTGTEKLLWDGTMPPFPGLGYPLVPGYEAVGRVTRAADDQPELLGRRVFVPGARCFGEIRGLFGGSASRLVVPAARVLPVADDLGAQGVLLALAATAFHVTGGDPAAQPDLIVGHGVLGRLLARIAVAVGAPPPTVWEIADARMLGARGYTVVRPDDDPRRDYRRMCEVSGSATLLDTLIGRLQRGGEIVLAGFYADRLAFAYPAAFLRELRLRISAEWQPDDLAGVNALIERGALNLDALITHQVAAQDAAAAYRTAFGDAHCLKMILDWRERS